MYGSIGKLGIATRELCTSQAIAFAIPDKSRVDTRYMFHFLLAQRPYLQAMGRGGTQSNIGQGDLKSWQMPLPPLPEQRRIADILDKADALRAKRRAALAKLDELIQSIFLDMFGDPATNPKDWPVRPVRDVLAVPPIFGTMIPASEEGGGWLCIRVANIQNWTLSLNDSKYVELPSQSVSRHAVQDGDLLFARAIATQEHLGKAIVVYPADRQWAFDSHLMRLRPRRDTCIPEYLREMLKSPGGRSRFLHVTRRSAVQFNINTKELSALQLPIAPIELQRNFLSRLRAIEKLRTKHEALAHGMNVLFASLQHRAFRGEL
jgi:type I restriction enzyme S subunit